MKKLFGNVKANINTITPTAGPSKKIVTLVLVAVLAGTGIGYYKFQNRDKVTTDVFWSAVDNSLKTTLFSRHSTAKSGGQSSDQVTDVFISPKQGVHSQTKFIQTGVDEAEATTENLGTAYSDYVRYVSISTSQKNEQGKPYDFSKIVNVWAGTPEDKKETSGQQFGQGILSAIPAGNLTAEQRGVLTSMMAKEKVYDIQVVKTTREGLLRRPTYTYSVTLKPSAYVKVLKQFGDYVGITQLKGLDPSQYENAPDSAFEVSIDGWSRQITGIMQPGTNKRETISGHNARKTYVDAPKDYISVDDLQTRLQTVQ